MAIKQLENEHSLQTQINKLDSHRKNKELISYIAFFGHNEIKLETINQRISLQRKLRTWKMFKCTSKSWLEEIIREIRDT